MFCFLSDVSWSYILGYLKQVNHVHLCMDYHLASIYLWFSTTRAYVLDYCSSLWQCEVEEPLRGVLYTIFRGGWSSSHGTPVSFCKVSCCKRISMSLINLSLPITSGEPQPIEMLGQNNSGENSLPAWSFWAMVSVSYTLDWNLGHWLPWLWSLQTKATSTTMSSDNNSKNMPASINVLTDSLAYMCVW